MIPQDVQNWLAENGFGAVTAQQSVAGGCINNGTRLQTESGRSFFLKTNNDADLDMFEREAEGLDVLRQAAQSVHGPRFPEPLLFGPDFILLEDLTPAPKGPGYWESLGRSLAALHNVTHPQFGFNHDNYIGLTPQPNPWTRDGHAFFAEQRLNYQARLAVQQGLLSRAEADKVERICARLRELVPPQPASLLHGDLWSGNVISDGRGAPALIDPAAHYGWAEAELAMTTLFGSFPDAFYRAYQEVRPLEPDFRQRYALYNLYHLLNHLNLFGSGYLGQVLDTIRRYVV